MEKLLNIEELAENLGLDESWIYTKTRTKEIPHIKLGKYLRFSENSILEWLDSHKQGPSIP
jgi:excisionase family DNA binding protein